MVDMPVSFIDAALGTDIEVAAYPEGSIKLRLPAGTQTGSVFRVKGVEFQTENQMRSPCHN